MRTTVFRHVRVALAIIAAVAGTLTVQVPAIADPDEPAENSTRGPVIVVGIAGLTTDDITSQTTPNLWALADTLDVADLTVRTVREVTCPMDGWLTLGAGTRSQGETPAVTPAAKTRCTEIPTPVIDGSSAAVDMDPVVEANTRTNYEPDTGSLATAVTDAGGTALAVGPGAAWALASANGEIANYRVSDTVTAADLASHDLTIIDAGAILDSEMLAQQAVSRDEQRASVDAHVGDILRFAPENADIILLGISSPSTDPSLGFYGQLTPTGKDRAWLTSHTTQRTAIVQLTDVLPTLCALKGFTCSELLGGAPVERSSELAPANLGAALTELTQLDEASAVVRSLVAPISIFLGIANVLVLAFVLLTLRSSNRTPRKLTIMRIACGTMAIAPLATFVGIEPRWWTTGTPLLALLTIMLAAWALLAILVNLGPWRRHLMGPAVAAGAVTTTVLIVDTLTGTHLQWMSVLGDTPTVAGRFYGISNSPYSLAVTGLLLTAAGLSRLIIRRWGRGPAIALVLGLGLAFTVLTGMPNWGANFGGTIATAPGFVVLALFLWGRPPKARHVIGAVGLGVLAVATLAFIDFLRPLEAQTHLGLFVGQLLDGDVWNVIWRKLEASLRIVGGSIWFTVAVILAVAVVAAVLLLPRRFRLTYLAETYYIAPELRAATAAVITTFAVAVWVKDSGVAMPLIATLLYGPALLSVVASVAGGWRENPAITDEADSADHVDAAPAP